MFETYVNDDGADDDDDGIYDTDYHRHQQHNHRFQHHDQHHGHEDYDDDDDDESGDNHDDCENMSSKSISEFDLYLYFKAKIPFSFAKVEATTVILKVLG